MEMMDVLEEMEHIVPGYSYASIESMKRTDRHFKEALISEIKNVKEMLFRAVQAAYELGRDKLSEKTDSVWLHMDNVLSNIENSRTFRLGDASEKACQECIRNVERNMERLMRKDREIASQIAELRKMSRMINKALFDRGDEKYFLRNIDNIESCSNRISDLMDERDVMIMGLQ